MSTDGVVPESQPRNSRSTARTAQGERKSIWSSIKRLVYRTPQDIINEIGITDDQHQLTEKSIYVCRHHWVMLLRDSLLPLGLACLVAALAYYRAIGGDFLELDVGTVGEVDLFNRFIIFLIVAILVVWFLLPMIMSNRRKTRQALIGLAALLSALFYFRYQGGRFFYVTGNPNQAFDTFNILLLGIICACLLWGIYVVFDWLNDFLILTDHRVIYDDEKLFVRRVQDQITIDDIQNVQVRTGEKTLLGYIQHHLKFGTIIVQSASFRKDIVFKTAHNPAEMQRQIMGEVKKLQANRSKEDFENIIKTKIFKTATKPAPPPPEPASRSAFNSFLGKILLENPEQKADGTITWHPHWIFAVTALARPVGAFLLLLVILWFGVSVDAIPGGWFWVVLLSGIIGFILWFAWVFEDYCNDLYILTPSQVIDVQKIPFGPENRRSAGLGSLQNVQLKTTFIGRLIGYGNVELETAGGRGDSKFTFYGVPDPNEVVFLINQYRAEFKRGEKERSLNDTITLLTAFYNQMQQQHTDS